MSIPLPPGFKLDEAPVTIETTPETPTIVPSAPSYFGRAPMKEPQPLPPRPKKIDRDETTFLLDAHLNPRNRQDPKVIGFIKEYMLCRNVKQAAESVGLTTRDGNALRKQHDIHKVICKLTDIAVFRNGFDAGELIARVKEVSDVDVSEFENSDGSYKESLLDVSPETRRAIKSFTVKNTYGKDPNGMDVITGKIIKVEMWDKMKAVELLGREVDIFKEKKVVQHDIGKNMSETLLEARKRADDRVAAMTDVTPQQIEYTEVEDE